MKVSGKQVQEQSTTSGKLVNNWGENQPGRRQGTTRASNLVLEMFW